MTLRASACMLASYFFEWFILQIIRLFTGPTSKEEEDVNGKVVVITGANGGLGKYSTSELVKRGAKVVMGCRNMTEGKKALEEVRITTGSDALFLYELDLSDMNSIRKFAADVSKKFPQINMLINNAGISLNDSTLSKTKDGFEMHFGVNHLGHFLLTNLLEPNLRKGGPSKVITVSSTAAVMTNLDMDDLMMENASGLGLGNTMPYNNSKFANILFSKELSKRFADSNIKTYCVCPGLARTQVFRHYSRGSKFMVDLTLWLIGLPVEKAADIILYCALAKERAHETGKMYRFGIEFKSIEKLITDDLAKTLWEKSEVLVGLQSQ